MKRLVLVLVLALWAGEAFAHGVGYRPSEMKAVALEFFYSTGEKMSYREAKVFSPSDEKFAAQTGRTDEQGRFAFVPDVPGEWRVIVRDEEGHQCTATVNVSDTLSASVQQESNDDMFTRALLGVSIIFNIALFIKWRGGHAH